MSNMGLDIESWHTLFLVPKTKVYVHGNSFGAIRTNQVTWVHVPGFDSALLLLLPFFIPRYFFKLQIKKKKTHKVLKS